MISLSQAKVLAFWWGEGEPRAEEYSSVEEFLAACSRQEVQPDAQVFLVHPDFSLDLEEYDLLDIREWSWLIGELERAAQEDHVVMCAV